MKSYSLLLSKFLVMLSKNSIDLALSSESCFSLPSKSKSFAPESVISFPSYLVPFKLFNLVGRMNSWTSSLVFSVNIYALYSILAIFCISETALLLAMYSFEALSLSLAF